jgi:acyl CoA:acetate/3-ketoacid CoA transferase
MPGMVSGSKGGLGPVAPGSMKLVRQNEREALFSAKDGLFPMYRRHGRYAPHCARRVCHQTETDPPKTGQKALRAGGDSIYPVAAVIDQSPDESWAGR